MRMEETDMTQERFEEMVKQYGRLVFTVCNQLVGDAGQAEDLAQETFLSAWLHAARCPEGAEKAWLCRIAANKAKDCLKSAYRRRVTAAEEPGDWLQGQAGCAAAVSPEDAFASRETLHAVRGGIEGLRAPYKEVSALFFLENYSVAEIARLLGRPHKTVNTQLYRARSMLRGQLAAQVA